MLLAAAGAGTSARAPAPSGAAVVEVVVTLPQPPLAQAIAQRPLAREGDDDAAPARPSSTGQRELPAHARIRAALAAGADHGGDSELERALALRRRPRRHGRRRPALAARAAQLDSRRQGLAEPDVPLAARPHAETDLGADGVGTDARDRRAGREDRDPRRRPRPDVTSSSIRRTSRTPPASRKGTPRSRRRR